MVLAENPEFLRNRMKEIQIKDKSGTWNYKRQQLVSHRGKGKKDRQNPKERNYQKEITAKGRTG